VHVFREMQKKKCGPLISTWFEAYCFKRKETELLVSNHLCCCKAIFLRHWYMFIAFVAQHKFSLYLFSCAIHEKWSKVNRSERNKVFCEEFTKINIKSNCQSFTSLQDLIFDRTRYEVCDIVSFIYIILITYSILHSNIYNIIILFIPMMNIS
jgi:hypothetical protein